MPRLNEFPAVVTNVRNAVDPSRQSAGVEGYIFDGVDGSQAAFWTCLKDGVSREHAHPYEEYFLVIQGRYMLLIGGKRVTLKRGDEYLIPVNMPHAGEFKAGTRTVHVFGGRRAERKS